MQLYAKRKSITFRTVFLLCKKDLPFRGYGDIISLQSEHGAQMGDYCRSTRTAINMAKSISQVLHQDLIETLLESDAPLSMIVDGSTAKNGLHFVSVIFQFVGKH